MKKSLLLINLLFLSMFAASQSGSETHDGCEGDGYFVVVNDTTYDESNPSGTETITGGASDGTDSTVVIDLTFKAPGTNLITYEGCEGDGYEVEANGTTYDESNPSAIDTIVGAAANGCDSIITVDLEFVPASTGIDEIVACESYTWIDGIEYTESNNTATDTLTGANSCDSIVTLNLTITPTLDVTVDDVLNSSNDFVLIAQQDNASYQWLDCNSNAPISGQNNQTFIPTSNGSYAVRLSKGACVDTSSCFEMTTLSTNNLSINEEELSIYPNPSEGVFKVSGYSKETSSIVVLDALGRQILDAEVTKETTTIDLSNKQNGVYFFRIIEKDEQSLHKVILK